VISDTALALVAGAIALWVFDASLLLFRDEVVFVHARRRWRASLGNGFSLGGRDLALWMPGTPVFRAGWSDAARREGPRAPMRVVLRALRPLQWAGRVLAVLLFVGMPAGLFFAVGHAWMLALVLALYGLALACIAWAWRCRRVFGLDRRGWATLAFDVIACPPFAINVAMKITLRLGLPEAPEAFARRVLAPAECAALLHDAHARMHPDAPDGDTTP